MTAREGFLSFERIEMAHGERIGRTRFVCTLHSVLNGNEITLEARVELPTQTENFQKLSMRLLL